MREIPPFQSILVSMLTGLKFSFSNWYAFMEEDKHERGIRRFVSFMIFFVGFFIAILAIARPGPVFIVVFFCLGVAALFDLVRLVSYFFWVKQLEAEGGFRPSESKSETYKSYYGDERIRLVPDEEKREARKAQELPYRSLWVAVLGFFARMFNNILQEAVRDLRRNELGQFCAGLVIVSAILVTVFGLVVATNGFLLIVPAVLLTALEGVQFLFTFAYNSTRK